MEARAWALASIFCALSWPAGLTTEPNHLIESPKSLASQPV